MKSGVLSRLKSWVALALCDGAHYDEIIVRNPTDASVVQLLAWKFFCNPSTSPSFVSEARTNNRQMWLLKKFNVIYKHVIYIILLLPRLTSSNGFQWCHLMTSLNFIKMVTGLTDIQVRKRKFFQIKYTRRHCYANFGTFFLRHPVYMLFYWNFKT